MIDAPGLSRDRSGADMALPTISDRELGQADPVPPRAVADALAAPVLGATSLISLRAGRRAVPIRRRVRRSERLAALSAIPHREVASSEVVLCAQTLRVTRPPAAIYVATSDRRVEGSARRESWRKLSAHSARRADETKARDRTTAAANLRVGTLGHERFLTDGTRLHRPFRCAIAVKSALGGAGRADWVTRATNGFAAPVTRPRGSR